MKKFRAVLLTGSVISLMAISCAKESLTDSASATTISSGTLAKIGTLGFDANKVVKVDEGYLVEGDILLTDADLDQKATSPEMIIGDDEHYRTTNLVTGLPRTIKVTTSNLPTVYTTACQDAIARYNALNLQLHFTFVSSGANITLIGFNEGPSGGYITLGSSGFPSGGNPYSQIKMNTNSQAYGTNPNEPYLASVIAHEMGHCIGFRHTDYMNRSYSCGGSAVNEGASTIGAIHIPGTPTGADPNSWMLSCSGGTNRPFTTNDKTALNYLY